MDSLVPTGRKIVNNTHIYSGDNGHGNHWCFPFLWWMYRPCEVQEKDLKIDPLRFEIGRPRERGKNSKQSIFRPFPWVKTIGNFSFCFMAPKCMVGITLNFFFIEFLDHVMYGSYTKAFEKDWYTWAQHKVESKAWSCLVDLPPIAMECGFMCMLCSSGDLETSFSESGKVGPFSYGKYFV